MGCLISILSVLEFLDWSFVALSSFVISRLPLLSEVSLVRILLPLEVVASLFEVTLWLLVFLCGFTLNGPGLLVSEIQLFVLSLLSFQCLLGFKDSEFICILLTISNEDVL
jgi:hypothetical protein